MQPHILAGLLFGALTLLDAGALYAVHIGIVDIPLSRLDYLESTLSIPASLFACIGLCASKRWGWFSGGRHGVRMPGSLVLAQRG